MDLFGAIPPSRLVFDLIRAFRRPYHYPDWYPRQSECRRAQGRPGFGLLGRPYHHPDRYPRQREGRRAQAGGPAQAAPIARARSIALPFGSASFSSMSIRTRFGSAMGRPSRYPWAWPSPIERIMRSIAGVSTPSATA